MACDKLSLGSVLVGSVFVGSALAGPAGAGKELFFHWIGLQWKTVCVIGRLEDWQIRGLAD